MSCRRRAERVARAAGAGGLAGPTSLSGYETGRRAGLWAAGGRRLEQALRRWRADRDDPALARVRAEVAAALADRARAAGRPDHPAGAAATLAEERARLLLAPPKRLPVGERVERVASLEQAIAWLRLKRAINERQYRAALIETLCRRWLTPLRSQAPVDWLPARPVGAETETASPVDPGRTLRVRYRLVELAEPVASHTQRGSPNPAYDPALQPRRRDRAAGQQQIETMARRLAPEALLKAGADWAEGPPLVGPDGQVESGNGRLLALRQAVRINPDGYAAYRRRLADRAAGLGLARTEVEQLAQPLLVRERLTPLDAEARSRFVIEANAGGPARMGPAEQARADAGRIPPGFFSRLRVAPSDRGLAGVLAKQANTPLVAGLVARLPASERAGLMDARGRLSAEGSGRLERAALAYAMPGRAGQRLAGLLFEQGQAIDRVGAGLRAALPRLLRLEDAIRAGQRAASLSLGHDLPAAVTKLYDLRRQGLSVAEYRRQARMFEGLSPLQEQWLLQLDRRRRSARQVAGLIEAYAAAGLAIAPPAQGRLPEPEPALRGERLLRTALKEVGGDWIEPARPAGGTDGPAKNKPRRSPWVKRWPAPAAKAGQTYTVAQDRWGRWGCSCPGWKYQKKPAGAGKDWWRTPCAHIRAIRAKQSDRQTNQE